MAHDHAVALDTQNGVRPTRDSQDRLPDERFKEGTGSRLNKHGSDYRLLAIDGKGAPSWVCGLTAFWNGVLIIVRLAL